MSVRLSRDNPDGFVVHSFAGDDPIACRDYVRERLGMVPWRPGQGREGGRDIPVPPAPAEPSEGPDGWTVDDHKRHRWAMDVWEQSVEARGTLVAKYLREVRCIPLDDDDRAWESIRFHHALKLDGERVPAMVSLLRAITGDKPQAVIRCFLTPAGAKIRRANLGPSRGAVCKLDPDDEVTDGLFIGEGVETVLAGRALGFRPAWATGGVAGIAGFPVLSGIEHISIFRENDRASFEASGKATARLMRAGCAVTFITPAATGDLNDLTKRIAG